MSLIWASIGAILGCRLAALVSFLIVPCVSFNYIPWVCAKWPYVGSELVDMTPSQLVMHFVMSLALK